MPTGIELRPILYARQLNDVLERIISVLKDFRPQSIDQLKSKSLCYHRDGKIDICSNPCTNSLNDWCLMAFYEYVKDNSGNVFNLGLNYNKIIEFAGSLVSESPFDEELVKIYYLSPNNRGKNIHPNDITDPILYQKYCIEDWWEEYEKVRSEVSELCYQIASELRWTSRSTCILKDEILERVYNLPNYMPARMQFYKDMCKSTLDELYKNGGLNALSLHNKHTWHTSEPYIRNFFYDKNDLFTETTIEDLLLYIVAIDNFFINW